MPTGYTHKVGNGEITDLSDMVSIFSKAFGFMVHMRDKDLTPELEEPPHPESSNLLSELVDDLSKIQAKNILTESYRQSLSITDVESLEDAGKQTLSARAHVSTKRLDIPIGMS